MCDTLVALNKATADGSVILAKNSDRAPNEAQYPVFFERQQHGEATVRCTHITIPQVRETFAVLLSKPFWMWGCEMGANEFGVVIGNEAVFTKEPKAASGLLGMDLIRLALERADTARGALDVIVDLLAAHGQGGSCDIYRPRFTYHNSFLIADPGEAWVLETAGHYWAAVKVEDAYSISNVLTIGADYDLASPGLVEHAVDEGWCKGEADFHFSRCYSDVPNTRLAASKSRLARTRSCLQAERGAISVRTMLAALRDHGQDEADPAWRPGAKGATVCMHAVDDLARRAQSTASLVAHLRPEMPVYWMTGTSAPCSGLFKPFYVGPLPSQEIGEPAGEYDPETMWWQHERLHRALLADYATRLPVYRRARDELEETFLCEEARLYERYRALQPAERGPALAEHVRSACHRAAEATARWTEQVRATPAQHSPGPPYREYWQAQNRIAQFPRSEFVCTAETQPFAGLRVPCKAHRVH